jgi:hypothetical protein
MASLGRITRMIRDLRYTVSPRSLHRIPRHDPNQPGEARDYFVEHGWALMGGLFTPDEVARLREGVGRSDSDGLSRGDLLANPHLWQVVCDERVLRVVHAFLGGPPTYFGDSGWNIGYALGNIGFHKDNPDKQKSTKPDWQGPYTIIKVGIYLQDHAWHSGGLAVRDRSHNTVDTTLGHPIAVPSKVGDVIVWYLRTTHSGYVSRLRLVPKVVLPLPLLAKITVSKDLQYEASETFFRPLEHGQRMSMFASYGRGDHHERRYLDYLKTRKFAVESWQRSQYTDEARALTKKRGLTLVEVGNSVKHVDLTTLDVAHNEEWDNRL